VLSTDEFDDVIGVDCVAEDDRLLLTGAASVLISVLAPTLTRLHRT
jgi:hypothetical protein